MLPPKRLPVTSTRSSAGTGASRGSRTSTLPPVTATSSVSTTIPGLVIRIRFPPATTALICNDGSVITASVKSSMTFPPVTRISMRSGTTQRPSRRALAPCRSMRSTSFGLGAAATPGCAAGRSATRAASSPYVRAARASSIR